MYNYQKYVQSQQIKSQTERLISGQNQFSSQRRQKLKELLNFHAKRIETSIYQLGENPKIVNHYKDNAYQPREQDKSKWITHGYMVFNYQNEATRVEQVSKKHRQLDLIPSKKLKNFRNSFEETQILLKEAQIQKSKKKHHTSSCSTTGASFNELYFPMLQNKQKDQKLYLHTYQTIVYAPNLGLKAFQNSNFANSMTNMNGREINLIECLNENDPVMGLENRKKQIILNCKMALKKCGLISTKLKKLQAISKVK